MRSFELNKTLQYQPTGNHLHSACARFINYSKLARLDRAAWAISCVAPVGGGTALAHVQSIGRSCEVGRGRWFATDQGAAYPPFH